jgi:hypothetical protein
MGVRRLCRERSPEFVLSNRTRRVPPLFPVLGEVKLSARMACLCFSGEATLIGRFCEG